MTLDCSMSRLPPLSATSNGSGSGSGSGKGKGKARAESPSHSQAVTQAQIQGIDISGSGMGLGLAGSGAGAAGPSRNDNVPTVGFRHIPRETVHDAASGPAHGHEHEMDSEDGHEMDSEDGHEQSAGASGSGNKEAFVDGGDGRTLCVRHQMMADQGVNGKLQKTLDSLPVTERAEITSLWSTFSSSAHPKRKLILEGLLTMCCFSQLSHLQESLHVLIRVDPFSLFPREVSLRVLGYLDAISLGKAAQVSRQWKSLADDDLLWRRMCGQHIERKCVKCGWGLPLLERRRLRNELDHGAPVGMVGDLVHVDGEEHGEGEEGHVPVKVARRFESGWQAGTNAQAGPSDLHDKAMPVGVEEHPGFSCTTDIDFSRFPQLGIAAPRSAIPAYMASSHPHPPPFTPVVQPQASPIDEAGPSSLASSGTLKRPAEESAASTAEHLAPPKRARYEDLSSSEGELGDHAPTSEYLDPVKRSLEVQARKQAEATARARKKPWKHVYCERLIVERNWRKGRCEIRTLKGHTNGVMCLQFHQNLPTASPSYPVLITGSYDRTARVWNLETGECVKVLSGHTRAIRALQFDGMMLITGSMDRTLRIWNWRTGDCVRVLEGHTDGIVCLNYDREVLASGSADSTIKIWDFKTKDCFTLRGHEGWVNSVLLWDGKTAPHDQASMEISASHAGTAGAADPAKYLFSASDDETIKFWDILQRTCLRTFSGHNGQVQSLKLIVVDTESDVIEEETAVTGYGEQVQPSGALCSTPFVSTFHSASVGVPSASAPPGTSQADVFQRASASPPLGYQPLSYRDRRDGTQQDGVHLHPDSPPRRPAHAHFDVGEDKQALLISCGLDNLVKVWDVNTGREKRTLFGHIEGVWAVDADPLRAASGSHDRTIKIWDRESGKCAQTLVGHRGAVTSLQLSDDVLVSGSDDGEVKVWNFGPTVSGRVAAEPTRGK